MDHRVVKIRYRAIVVGGSLVPAISTLLATVRDGAGAAVRRRLAAGCRGGSSAVGQPLGAAAFPDFGAPSNAPFSGRAGSHGKSRPGERSLHARSSRFHGSRGLRPPSLKTFSRCRATQYGELELPADFVDYGTPGNMDLDAAINMLVSQNLDLMAAKLEIPMAEADVLTANLRANPIFYADTAAHPLRPFLVLEARRSAAERRQHQLSAGYQLQEGGTHGFGTRGQERDGGPAPGRGPQPDRQPLHGLRGSRRRGPDPEVQRGLSCRESSGC